MEHMKYTHKDPNASGVACKLFLPSGVVIGTNLSDIPALELDDTTTTLTNSSSASDTPLLIVKTNSNHRVGGGDGDGDGDGESTNSVRSRGGDTNSENRSEHHQRKDEMHSPRFSLACNRLALDQSTNVVVSETRNTLPAFSTVLANSAAPAGAVRLTSNVSLAEVLPSSVLITPTSIANGGGIAFCRQQQQQQQQQIRQQVLNQRRQYFPLQASCTETSSATDTVRLADVVRSNGTDASAVTGATAAAAFLGNCKSAAELAGNADGREKVPQVPFCFDYMGRLFASINSPFPPSYELCIALVVVRAILASLQAYTLAPHTGDACTCIRLLPSSIFL